MHITRLELKQFRNYEEAVLRPCTGITVLYGNNAQGKTALLEAIVLSCTGRSHRTSRDRELIFWGQPAGRVFVQAEKRDGSHEVEMLLSDCRRKIVKVNGGTLQRTGELMGHINGVLFAPEDLRMVKDGPSERRRFIDMELSQIKPAYYYALQHYAHALMQRNKLLRDMAVKPSLRDMLEDWDVQLARYGAAIMLRRAAFVERLSQAAHENHLEISGGLEDLKARYVPGVDLDGDVPEQALLRALRAAHETDIRRGTTTVGPHRDDLMLTISGMDVRMYGSQGQQRTTALSLKLAELDIMRSEIGEWPVLMLDDVMSELDPKRRRQLLARLEGIQTIVTCTDLSDLAEAQIGAAWRIENGRIVDQV